LFGRIKIKNIFVLADRLFCIAECNHQALTARACGLKKYLQKILIGRTFLRAMLNIADSEETKL
tara:strand:- start:189 stop:380 length:192 start_codon:yes stop_codon:yes gene_type:complete